MSSGPSLPPGGSSSGARAPRRRHRIFYAGAALVMLGVVFAGFREYYLNGTAPGGRPLPPPIRGTIVVHGIAMTAWMLVFLAQTAFIAAGRRRTHAVVGSVAAVLAVVIVASGLWVSLGSTRLTPPGLILWGLDPSQFMAVSVLSILLFGAFVAVGLIFRRKPAIHGPMMLLATLSTTAAAFGRMGWLGALYGGTAWERVTGPFLAMFVLGAVLLAAKCVAGRTVDRPFAVGYAALVVACLGIIVVARTPAWNGFVAMLLQPSP